MRAAIHVHPDASALATAAAQRVVALAAEAIRAHGHFHIALSGGSTPRRLYETLAQPQFRNALDWSRTHLFFGDERCVPPDHPDSNYRMATESLLGGITIPPAHVHRMVTTPLDPRRDAWRYGKLLQSRLPTDADGVPQFDLILLGLGPDGHTASLFPNTCILRERARPVAAVYVDRLQAWRVSLTYPVLEHARHLLFLVAGRDKADIVRRIVHTATPDTALPAGRIEARGQVEWHLDRDAAAQLNAESDG